MLTLTIYRHGSCWCFDDETFGLQTEPFVLGMSEIISSVIKENCPDPAEQYTIIFSDQEFPRAQGCLVRTEFEHGGAWYYRESSESIASPGTSTKIQQGWLCPATLHYFDSHPEKIYFSISASLP